MNKISSIFNPIALSLFVIGLVTSIIFENSNTVIGIMCIFSGLILLLFSIFSDIFFEKQSKKVYFAKLNENAVIPSKDEENGGYDIYATITDDVIINPNETVMIPTGLCSAFSSKYVFILKERGSTGTKGIGQRCGVIDSGFRGEWKVPVTNHGTKRLIISCGKHDDILNTIDNVVYPAKKAICQAILVEVPEVDIIEQDAETVKNISSIRGEGMLGSSGK